MTDPSYLSRRRFLGDSVGLGFAAWLARFSPAYVWAPLSRTAAAQAGPTEADLRIARSPVRIGEREATAITINDTMPGPLVRLHEGERATLRVHNALDESTSIHWHGLLVPPGMDGVPGVSFAGIDARKTFTYDFEVKQSGTYWYHSHSGLQEQSGHFGPLIVDPREPEPFAYDRDYVVMLSDWTFEDPLDVLANLKKFPGYYNFQRPTMAEMLRSTQGWTAAFGQQLPWERMRMDPSDIADVTGYTYTYLVNGLPPQANWTALFRPGERVRLRFINAAAASYFDVRIPGLPMTVVQADGQYVAPVTIDEFRIAIAETYDVIVEPRGRDAYTLFAEAMDRSGYARGTLAVADGLSAPLPARRTRQLRTMADMGMGNMEGMNMSAMSMGEAGEKAKDAPASAMDDTRMTVAGGAAASQRSTPIRHAEDQHGPGNAMVADWSSSRLDEPGGGLDANERRVLVYSDLRSLDGPYDAREAGRDVELHLTGVMDRYMWSFDGKKYSEVDGPIRFEFGERLRLILVNDTMMDHPIHLHGMWMELENGARDARPRKHTLNVKPAERVTALVTADAPGNWAFHCHILYHMEMGMFRVVSVSADRRTATS